MNELATAIGLLLQLWANHQNKPQGYVPTQEEVQSFVDNVDAATPTARKAAARARLGLPPV